MSSERYQIREIRQDELAEAVAFAHAQGSAIETASVRPWLSLVARDAAGQVCGAVFCVVGGHSNVTLEVIAPAPTETNAQPQDDAQSEDDRQEAAPAEAEPVVGLDIELAQRLLDKALGKMRCRHVHHCAIRMHQPEAAAKLWDATRWADDVAGTASADTSSCAA